MHVNVLKLSQVADGRRDGARDVVAGDVEALELPESAEVRRKGTGDVIVGDVELPEPRPE
jgi:hypothetical protein